MGDQTSPVKEAPGSGRDPGRRSAATMPSSAFSAAPAIATGVFWIVLYLTLVLTPVIVLLIGDAPAGGGFWWDFAIALGFAGMAMMGIQFVLTARFKRATAPYGIDIIYFFHRHVAVIATIITLAHPVILVLVNPAFLRALNPFVAPWHMVAGVLSAAALLLLLISSLWRKQLHIHYDAWRTAHGILAVSAAALALVHVHGVDYYIASAWKNALWTVIVLSWIAILVYIRVVKPLLLRRAPYRVCSVTPERGRAWSLSLEPLGHDVFGFEPGQFAWLTLRRSPFAMREHPFSISSSPTRRARLEFTIKELGDFTRTIGRIRPGELAYVDGPYGAFSIDRCRAPGYVFLAGGIGIAPVMSMLRALADRGDRRPLLLIDANKRWERVTFREEIALLPERLNLRLVHVLEEPPQDWQGETGLVRRELLERHLPPERATLDYFICGPEAMIAVVENILYEMGIPLAHLHSELFDLV
jgi:predicted ferric reductase